MAYLDELFSVAGKTALVTGANSGIGQVIATRLAQAGYDVAINFKEETRYVQASRP